MASDAAPRVDLDPEEAASPVAERVGRAHEVAAEMEAIFGQAAHEGRALAPRAYAQAPAARVERRPGSGPFTLTNVGGVLAAALAGVAIGSLLARVPQFERHAAPPTAKPAALLVEALPPLQTPQTVDEVLIASKAPPAETPAPRPRAAPVRAHAVHRPRATTQACCTYSQVAAADRRLRSAYDSALQRGVPRDQIVAAHTRWSSARRRGAHDPVRLIADYRDIAADLDRMSGHAPSHSTYAARDDRGPFRPRYAAWWR